MKPIWKRMNNGKKKATQNAFQKIKTMEINELNEWLWSNKKIKYLGLQSQFQDLCYFYFLTCFPARGSHRKCSV